MIKFPHIKEVLKYAKKINLTDKEKIRNLAIKIYGKHQQLIPNSISEDIKFNKLSEMFHRLIDILEANNRMVNLTDLLCYKFLSRMNERKGQI